MTRKQIAFDLDTRALSLYYPTEHWREAYRIIKKYMLANGFRWLQGSVYESVKPMNYFHVTRALKYLIHSYPWINLCMRDCRVSHIGRQYNLNSLFDKHANIHSRKEVEKRAMKDSREVESVRNRIKTAQIDAEQLNKLTKRQAQQVHAIGSSKAQSKFQEFEL